MSMKKFNDTIENRTRDLPACSAVPQPTAPRRAPDTASLPHTEHRTQNTEHRTQPVFTKNTDQLVFFTKTPGTRIVEKSGNVTVKDVVHIVTTVPHYINRSSVSCTVRARDSTASAPPTCNLKRSNLSSCRQRRNGRVGDIHHFFRFQLTQKQPITDTLCHFVPTVTLKHGSCARNVQ